MSIGRGGTAQADALHDGDDAAIDGDYQLGIMSRILKARRAAFAPHGAQVRATEPILSSCF
jgi:hypothetical protein